MRDVTVYFYTMEDRWIFFRDSRPTGFDTFHVREVPDDVTEEQVAEMADNRKAFIFERAFLLAPVTGNLTATATNTGTATWEEMKNAE